MKRFLALMTACVVGMCGAGGCSAVLGVGDWPDLVDGGDNDAERAPDHVLPSDREPPSESSADGGGPTCALPAGDQNGGLPLLAGYQGAGYQEGFGMGYCYAYSDSSQHGTSDSFVATSNLCGCGTSGPYGGSTYGGGIGCNLNQSTCDDAGACPGASPVNDLAILGIGIHYDLGTLPSTNGTGGVDLTINDGPDELDCPLLTPTGTCLWPMFIDSVSETNNLKMAPTGATHVNVQVTSGTKAEPWGLCVVSLAFVAPESGGIGDPCFKDEDCISSTCTGGDGGVGWCTKACIPTSDCNGNYSGNLNAQGNRNACTASSSCASRCTKESDCVSFGADCIGGICVARSPTAGIGDPCYVNEDCVSLSCGAIGFCTTDCTSAADCYGIHPNQENAQGTANACAPVDTNQDSCFPECTKASDCSMFRGSSCEAVDAGISVCSL
jgi:hypothetical protein